MGFRWEQHHSSYNLRVDTNPINWISVIGMTLLIGLLLLINTLLIRKTIHTIARDTGALILNCITIALFTLSAVLSYASTILVLLNSDFDHQLFIVDVFTKLSLCLYCGCQTLMIYAFTKRLDTVFHDTGMEYSPRVIKILRVLCALFAVFYLFLMISFIVELYAIYYAAAIIWIVVYFCLSLLLCVLFIRRIEKLMIDSTKIDDEFLYVILKSGILVPLCIGASFVCFSVMILIIFYFTPGEWNPVAMFWNVLDCSTSACCFFLLLPPNSCYYDKYCDFIHQLCSRKKRVAIEKQINISRMESQSVDKIVTSAKLGKDERAS